MKKINKIGYKIILLTILLLNIFIGSNIKQPIWLIQTLVSIFSLIYVVTKKVQKQKNVLIKGKIDIAVLFFMLSTIIPFIVHTYVTLDGVIDFILKYWSIYGFYILVRNIVTEKKRIEGIENTLIISSIIPIIIGYDKLTNNILTPLLDKINAVKIEDTRMISTFGYANTFAVYLSLTTSLAIERFVKTDKIKKILYAIYIVSSALTIFLTQSKMVLALIAFVILMFIIYGIKNKKIAKKWIILGVCLVVLFLVYVFIAKDIGKPLVVTEEEKTCVLRGFEKNTKYEFEFDIQTESDKDYNSFDITIVEVTRYFSEIPLTKIELGKFERNQNSKYRNK